jgi:hypothetical protein
MPLDADRPMLEQLEEATLVDDDSASWLDQNVMAEPERLSILTPIRLGDVP